MLTGGDIQELKNLVQTQQDMIMTQNEWIRQLSDQLDKQSEQMSQQQLYIDKRLEERNQDLLQTFNDILDKQKKKQSRKTFIERLFKWN